MEPQEPTPLTPEEIKANQEIYDALLDYVFGGPDANSKRFFVNWYSCRVRRKITIENPSLFVSKVVLIADVFLSAFALLVKAEPVFGMSPFVLIVVLLTLINTVRVLVTECF